MNKKILIFAIIIILIFVGIITYFSNINKKQSQPIAQVIYICNDNKTINATYYEGETKTVKSGERPIPTGSVKIVLSDGRVLNLAQTISADGTRYANSDESFVFWGKGNDALVLENGVEKNYIGCVTVTGNQEIQSNNQIDYKNISYQIDGQVIKLVNGKAEIEIAPGSASKQITQYFGNEATGDLNGDGKMDTAFLLTQDSGGSGIFYYVVVALSTDKGYQGTYAIFLGDRIAPQTTEIQNGKIIVNYADRKINEPMTTKPSVGVSKYFKIADGKLIEVNQ